MSKKSILELLESPVVMKRAATSFLDKLLEQEKRKVIEGRYSLYEAEEEPETEEEEMEDDEAEEAAEDDEDEDEEEEEAEEEKDND